MPSNFKVLSGASGEPNDPNFKNVTLLLHGDGSNGAQNNTFLDSSTNNLTITRNGNTTQGSFSPYGSNWSNYFDGSGDYLTSPSSSALGFGTGDFTVEAWVYTPAFSAIQAIIDLRSSAVAEPLALSISSTGLARSYDLTVRTGGQLNANQWNHIAWVRASGVNTVYVNGVVGHTWTNSGDYGSSRPAWIGMSAGGSSEPFTGYISNVRVVKGTAVYTAAFTPSTTPLTAITNTSLLTCQSNRFRDASTNNFTITKNGDVKVTNFAPFAPTAEYSTSANGGSAYMDGSGDDLRVTYSSTLAAGTGAYCVEAWVYLTRSTTYQGIAGTSSDGFCGFETNAGYWGYYFGTTGQQSTTPVVIYQWNHIAICRDGSGNGAFFVNGVRAATFTDNANKTGFGNLIVGFNGVGGGQYMQGHVSDYRYTKGSTPYNPSSTTVTIPSAPLTAATGTTVLLKCTNGAIFDNSMKNDLETVGNAQISTSVKKFGTGSMAFDGSGDYLYRQHKNGSASFGTGNFTIEAWIYPTTISSAGTIFDCRNTDTTSGGFYFGLYTSNSLLLFTNTTVTSGGTVSTNTWSHVALVRNGSTWTIYLNGTSVATYSSSASLTDDNFCIGSSAPVASSSVNYFNGYIDELRITNGVARYTANFTPPTAAFPNK